MLSNPRIGQTVRIRYNARIRPWMHLHDRVGVVITASRGRPRNHLVMVGGVAYVIPCGQLFREVDICET